MTHKDIIYSIIDTIEGGYYHPDMQSKLRGGDRMGRSGETMYGIDRKNGAPLFTTGTPSAILFWQVIDANFGAHHGDTSYYGDKADGRMKTPSTVGVQLRPLTAAMIEDAFIKNLQYLSDDAQRIVLNDPKLLLQFLYATWNGPGNFKKFADVINAAYSNGERSAEAFYNLIQDARRARGGLFAEGADKLDAIAATLPGNGSWFWYVLGAGLTLFLISKLVKS